MDTALTFKNILCTGKEAHIVSNYNKYGGMIEKESTMGVQKRGT